MRQIGKQILTIAAWLLLVVAAPADGLLSTIVTDPLTGVAIDGYDPVTYFTDSEPRLGKPDFEYDWAGVPWYFVSAANRDVFMRNPTVYAPQFGGHCLMSLARGYLSDGKPRLYAIEGMRLYFFYSSANRDAFLLSRSQAVADAGRNWPGLSTSLIGPDGETPVAAGLAVANAEPQASVAAAQTGAKVPTN
ncbi:MAG TPA: YHS domain-containing (seleno)protein [Devosia sp.]|nr:YHS domain-containing (seleno)protein [Devosia sp.]